MFDLFPGGFRGGCSSYGVYGPDFLLEEDVIVVMSNYRTGPFGFLSTEDKIVPGNAGLKDMVLALKWIQTNIKQFGGDPQKITIFGQSAGAAAVGLLVISKAAAGNSIQNIKLSKLQCQTFRFPHDRCFDKCVEQGTNGLISDKY